MRLDQIADHRKPDAEFPVVPGQYLAVLNEQIEDQAG